MDNNWQQGNGQANGQGYQYGNGQGNGQGQQPGNGQHWNDQSQQGREQHVQQAMTSVNTLNQLTGVGDNSLGARAGLGLVDGQHGIYMFMPLKGAGVSAQYQRNQQFQQGTVMEMDEGNGQPINDQAVVRGGISQIAPTRTIEDWRQQQHQHQHQQGGWSQRSSASQGSGYNTPTPQGQNSGQMYQQHQMQFGSQGQQGPSQQYTPRQGLFNSGSRPGSGLSRMGRQEAFDDAEYRDMAPSGLPPQYNGPASRTRDSYVPVFNNQDGSLALDIKNPATKHPRVQAQDQGMNNQAPAPATPQARKKTKKEADKEAIRILKAGLAPGYAYCSRCRKTALSEGNFTPKFDKKAKTLSKEMYADCNVCKEQRRVADLRKKEAKAAQGGGGNAAGVQAGNQDADEAQNEDEDEEMGDAEDEGGAPDNDHAPGPEGPPGPAFGAPGGPGGHPPHGDGGAGGAAGMDSAAEHPEHSFFVHHGEPQQAA